MKRGFTRTSRNSYTVSEKKSKKGVLGIETLIIFIAMILVAAVAAGVLIRTSGLLQQRALTVSGETIARVATGIELIQITANANTTDSYIREMELLIRLSAGSDTIKMRDLGLSYISEDLYITASIAHEDSPKQVIDDISFLNSTELLIQDMDNFAADNTADTVYLVEKIDNTTDHGLVFTLTTGGTFNVSLGLNLSNQSDVDIRDLLVDDVNNEIFGYIHLNGSFNGVITDTLNNSLASQNFTFEISHFPQFGCEFNTLRNDVDYCVDSRIGDSDINFESGELLILKYKLSYPNRLINDKKVEFSLIPAKAIVSTMSFYTPEAFPTYKVTLWP